MERATINTPLHGGFSVPDPRWWWFTRSLAFCPDPDADESNPPRDMGHWCHRPFVANPYAGPLRATNGFGPAMHMPNTDSGADLATSGIFQDDGDGGVRFGNASNHVWDDWTLAVGFERRYYYAPATTMINLYTDTVPNGTPRWELGITSQGVVGWAYEPGSVLVQTPIWSIAPWGYGPSQTIVVATRVGRDTTIYCNGKEVRSVAVGLAMEGLVRLHIGGAYAAKSNTAIAAAYGPVVLSRVAWAPAQVAQWHAKPWGWRAPAWEPQLPLYSPLVCDVQTRSAVAADGRTRAAVFADAQARAAVIADAQARAAAVADAQTRAAVSGDAQIQED